MRVEDAEAGAARRQTLAVHDEAVVRPHRPAPEAMAVQDTLKLPPVTLIVRVRVLKDRQRLLKLEPGKRIDLDFPMNL